MSNIKIISTLGPSSLNKKFLKFSSNKINLLRLNLSHLSINKLINNIKFIKKNSSIPICIDTEGAQIRTKVKKEVFYSMDKKVKIFKSKGNFCLYPNNVFSQLKKNDILNIGFSDLKLKILSIKDSILCKVIRSGVLENNKGVHLENRSIKLNFLTKKDYEGIRIGKKYKINYFALSFTNSANDIIKFNKLLKK